MRDVVPGDFVAWVSRAKGLRIIAFAEKIEVPMTYDGDLASVKTPYLTIKKPEKMEGVLMSPQQNLKAFWKAWRVRNSQERQES